MKKQDAKKFEACLRELYGERWEYKWKLHDTGFTLTLDVQFSGMTPEKLEMIEKYNQMMKEMREGKQ